MFVDIVSTLAFLFALIPTLLFLANLRLYRPPGFAGRSAASDPSLNNKDSVYYESSTDQPSVSILIPARNEEGSIGAAIEAALATRGIDFEIIVLDDHSTDATAEIVARYHDRDPRVRLEKAPVLPPGWCGKQHACSILASLAERPLLLFLDADVRLEPDGVARAVSFLRESHADLVSGVPRQITISLFEKMLIPLIHFVLLGFLPIARMRRSRSPAYAAGCGQLFLTGRSAYAQSGGHSMIRSSLHDGITLPRAYRRSGLSTDLFDATEIASCRMYASAAEVWRGLAKNATEGLGAPNRIVPISILLIGGQVVPFVLALFWPFLDSTSRMATIAGISLAWTPRLLSTIRFRQSTLGALLHAPAIAILVLIQWYALVRRLRKTPSNWRGRPYVPGDADEPASDAIQSVSI
jgi:hypothetical protein